MKIFDLSGRLLHKLKTLSLMKIINNCHKLILSESIISDNVFNLCSKRPDKSKIFIQNTFKKYFHHYN